jgi:hypothetical protein
VKLGGVVTAWTYYTLVFGNDVDALIKRLVHDFLADYWDERLYYVVEESHDLPFPFEPIDAPQFRTDMKWDMEGLLGYFETWSSSVKYRQAKLETSRTISSTSNRRFRALGKGRRGRSSSRKWSGSLAGSFRLSSMPSPPDIRRSRRLRIAAG